MRRVAISALVLLTAACSTEETSDFDTTASSGIGGNAGSSQGGQATGGTGIGGNLVGGTGSGAGSTGGSAAGGSGTGGNVTLTCPAGAIICEGNVAKVCDGNGGYSTEIDCDVQICAPNVGCVDCEPGSASCNGDVSTVCNNDGSGTTSFLCDPIQGVSCNQATGYCEGKCAPANIAASYIGCDYYPTVTNNALVSQTQFHYAVAVANTTNQVANITVTQGANNITTTTVGADSVEIIHLPWVSALSVQATTQIVTDGAYRLRSDQPITVYQYNPIEYTLGGGFTYTNDASLLLPVTAWTGNYRVVSRNNWQGIPGLYAVTASEDNTTVTVTPSATGGVVVAGAGISANGTGTVVLNASDVLQVFNASAGGSPDASDLTGTLITADKPVQIIGGHQCTDIPVGVHWCDHIEESMPPLETIATDYMATAPLINASTVKQRMVRVIATEDNTTISYDPAQAGAPTSLATAGDYFEIALTTADFLVHADKPIMVAQYMVGQQAGGNTGDPAYTLSVPTLQYRKEYLFHAPTNYEANYVNFVAPTGASITLDGAAVAGWTTIGTTGFDVARVQLSNSGNGNHKASSSLPFGISVYGYGQYTSYWYPGGLDLTPLGL